MHDNIKITQEIVDKVKENLIDGFFSKITLKEVAEHVTDFLDEN